MCNWQKITILFFCLIKILPAVYGDEVVLRKANKIVFGKSGTPKKLGYWEVNSKGKAISFLMEPDKDIVIENQNGSWALKRRSFAQFNNSKIPTGEGKPQIAKSECREVDLASKIGPVREQFGQTCYAFVANDLLSFGQEELYSPLYLAEQIKRIDVVDKQQSMKDALYQVEGFNSYSLFEALRTGMKEGLCPESALPVMNNKLQTNEDNYRLLVQYYKRIKAGRMNPDCEEFESEYKNKLSHLFRDVDFHTFLQVLKDSSNPTDFLRDLSKINCDKKINKEVVKNLSEKNIELKTILRNPTSLDEGFYIEERNKLVSQISATLDSGRPIGVYLFMANVLEPFRSEADNLESKHTVISVGKKWVDDIKDSKGNIIQPAGCYFLMKNSWGKDWKVPEGVDAFNTDRPGYFMISEKSLIEHTFTTVRLKE